MKNLLRLLYSKAIKLRILIEHNVRKFPRLLSLLSPVWRVFKKVLHVIRLLSKVFFDGLFAKLPYLIGLVKNTF